MGKPLGQQKQVAESLCLGRVVASCCFGQSRCLGGTVVAGASGEIVA